MLTAEGHDVVLVEDVLEVGFDALTESIAGRDLLIALTVAADSPWPWVAALDAIAVVRVALAHSGARVTLVTEADVAPADVDTGDDTTVLDVWVDDARIRAVQPCPPWRVADLCRALVPEGTSVEAARALAVAAALRALGRLVPAERFEHFVEPTAPRDASASMDPPLRVAPPPRPFRPDVVADRQQQALWDGCLKYGNRWTHRLERMLDEVLDLGPDRRVVVTTSGTDALRLAVAAVAPAPAPGATAILPSFTFPATAEVLVQLGYALRFVDVDASGWTLDPGALDRALGRARADVVVAVDTMGNPARYEELLAVCARHRVPLVADSAAALGSLYRGRPVGTQAAAHAFSMSFAKAVSAGGAGGAVVVPATAELPVRSGWPRNAMSELHAIAGVDQLEILPALMQQRSAVRAVYEALVQRHDNLDSQAVADADRHTWGFWVMRVGAGPARGVAGRPCGARYRDEGVLPGPAPLGLGRNRRRARREHRARRGSTRPAHVVGADGGARRTRGGRGRSLHDGGRGVGVRAVSNTCLPASAATGCADKKRSCASVASGSAAYCAFQRSRPNAVRPTSSPDVRTSTHPAAWNRPASASASRSAYSTAAPFRRQRDLRVDARSRASSTRPLATSSSTSPRNESTSTQTNDPGFTHATIRRASAAGSREYCSEPIAITRSAQPGARSMSSIDASMISAPGCAARAAVTICGASSTPM